MIIQVKSYQEYRRVIETSNCVEVLKWFIEPVFEILFVEIIYIMNYHQWTDSNFELSYTEVVTAKLLRLAIIHLSDYD